MAVSGGSGWVIMEGGVASGAVGSGPELDRDSERSMLVGACMPTTANMSTELGVRAGLGLSTS